MLSHTPRFAALTITGAAALSLVALSIPATAHAEEERVIGPISSVSGNTFQVTQPGGAAQVAFTGDTRISEAVPAQFAEVTPGACVKAGPTPDSAPVESGAITAKWVMISTAVDGKCPQRPGAAPDAGSRHGVRGIVDSVSGNTITVAGTAVNVTNDTGYRRRVPSSAAAISVGKCAATRGTKDEHGVLQAVRVTVWASHGGDCPQPEH